MNLYSRKSAYPKPNAQDNLMGRTHYVDPDTLRYHKSRIISARHTDNGLLFAIVESCAIDYHNTKRGYRFAIFDLWGRIVGQRASLDECWKTSRAAEKAMWAEVNRLDASAITLEGIRRANRDHADDMAAIAKVAAENVRVTA